MGTPNDADPLFVEATRSFLGTRQGDSVPAVSRIHMRSVG